MFVRELASRMPNPTPISVSAINPGFCDSRFTRSVEGNAVVKVIVRMMKNLLARTSEMGSRTLVHPAVEPGERARHGRFVSSCKVAEESDYILSDEGKEISRRVWVSVSSIVQFRREVWLTPFFFLKTETIEILGKIDPRVNQIVSEHLLAQ